MDIRSESTAVDQFDFLRKWLWSVDICLEDCEIRKSAVRGWRSQI